jgi:putative transposase
MLGLQIQKSSKNTPAITARVERKKKIEEFIIDETLIKIGSELIWLWVAIGLESKEILGIRISKERNILLAEQFISSLVKIHGQHPVSTDGGTWYPQACRFLRLLHMRKAL